MKKGGITMEKKQFDNLSDFFLYLFGSPCRKPLISVFSHQSIINSMKSREDCVSLSSDFYQISINQTVPNGKCCGVVKCDCPYALMSITSPGRELIFREDSFANYGRTILFHEGFVRGSAVRKSLKKNRIFSIGSDCNIDLSSREKCLIYPIFKNIEVEVNSDGRCFGNDIIFALLGSLFNYVNRFCQRNSFLDSRCSSTRESFISCVEKYMEDQSEGDRRIPTIKEIALLMGMSSRNLSDALKTETDKTAIENLHLYLIDISKDLLVETDMSVASVAYRVGFEYPQYFTRLFKKKTGHNPSEYRNLHRESGIV